MVKAVDLELDKQIANDIIEPVNKPSSWISPIVVVEKKSTEAIKSEDRVPDVRITIDSRCANKAVKRLHYSAPTTTEIAYDLNGATIFSKIDMVKAFHQLELDEGSREITTFTTHRGLFRYKRLHMGVNCATEIF